MVQTHQFLSEILSITHLVLAKWVFSCPGIHFCTFYAVQAGAGIVADSDPESEYQETMNKAAGLGRAIDLAEASFLQ